MISRQESGSDRAEAFGAILAPLLRQFWTIVLVVSAGALASLAYGRMQAPSFEASAVVQVRPGVDVAAAQDRLTSRRNLQEMALRHGLNRGPDGLDLERATVALRQSIAVHDLMPEAGATLGFDPGVAGIVVSVLLPDADLSARIANDLAQQVLDAGSAGDLAPTRSTLEFYRLEEVRLWQESSALLAEIAAVQQIDSTESAQRQLEDQRRAALLQDQYDLVRDRLAAFEVDTRLAAAQQSGRFSLLQRATSTSAVRVVRDWMLVGVAGSLLLAVALAFVLDRRYPALQRGPWDDLAGLRRHLVRAYRVVDDPARPILGLPRFVVVSAMLVVVLTGAAALIR